MREHAAYVFDLDGVVRDFAPGHAGRSIEGAVGWFTDDRVANVVAAGEFGRDAELFIPGQSLPEG